MEVVVLKGAGAVGTELCLSTSFAVPIDRSLVPETSSNEKVATLGNFVTKDNVSDEFSPMFLQLTFVGALAKCLEGLFVRSTQRPVRSWPAFESKCNECFAQFVEMHPFQGDTGET